MAELKQDSLLAPTQKGGKAGSRQIRCAALSLLFLQQLCLSQGSMSAITWYETDRDLCSEIEKVGLKNVLASSQIISQKSGVKACMRAFDAATRAGNAPIVLQSIKRLAALRNEIEKHDLSQMCDFLIDRKLWDLAQNFMEQIPDAEPGWGYILVRQLMETQTYEKTNSWLRKYQSHNPQFWISLRLGAAKKSGRTAELINELALDFKKNPGLETLRLYVLSLNDESKVPEETWVYETFKPGLAFDAWQAAEILGQKKHAALASKYLDLSISLPYTKKDQELMQIQSRKFSARFFPADYSFEKDLRTSCKQMLAQCYQNLGQAKKAQELLLELSNENQGQMPIFAMTQLAGQIQATTASKVLEKKVLEAEPKNENDPNYWLGRARYYTGRNENEQTVSALKKAMSLTQISKNSADQNQSMIRMMVVSDYAYYLNRKGKKDEALQLYWNEYASAGSKDQRTQILRAIWNLDAGALSYNDPRLWDYLKEIASWEYFQEHMLMTMSQRCPAAELNKFWSQLEALAKGNAERSLVLAWVMTRRNESKRSLPLLQSCHAKFTDEEKKQRAVFTEMEAQLDLKNWQAAEKLFPEAKKRLQTSELPSWITRICILAAQAGSYENAFRLWKAKDKIDRNYLDPLEELGKFPPLRLLLQNYYKEMAVKEPQSKSICHQALVLLH